MTRRFASPCASCATPRQCARYGCLVSFRRAPSPPPRDGHYIYTLMKGAPYTDILLALFFAVFCVTVFAFWRAFFGGI